MNSHHFQPGQRVLCIDGSFHSSVWEYVDEVPLEGEIYTVSKIRLGGRDNVTGKIGPAIGLREISGALSGCRGEVCWLTRRFVPLDLQQTNAAENTRSRRHPKKRKIRAPRRPLQPTSSAPRRPGLLNKVRECWAEPSPGKTPPTWNATPLRAAARPMPPRSAGPAPESSPRE